MRRKFVVSGFAPIFIIIIIMLIAAGIYLLSTRKTLVNNTNTTFTDNPTSTIIPSTNPSPLVTSITGGKCVNSVLGISISVPKGWTCKSQELSEDGWMDIKSDFFTIAISNLGRGPYCGDGETLADTDDSCRTSTFISNDIVTLTLFSYYGEDKEIFGGIVPLNRKEQFSKTWISIKYNDMEKQKLSDGQKEQLLNVLNTISLTK